MAGLLCNVFPRMKRLCWSWWVEESRSRKCSKSADHYFWEEFVDLLKLLLQHSVTPAGWTSGYHFLSCETKSPLTSHWHLDYWGTQVAHLAQRPSRLIKAKSLYHIDPGLDSSLGFSLSWISSPSLQLFMSRGAHYYHPRWQWLLLDSSCDPWRHIL